jgi:hypothetical protein
LTKVRRFENVSMSEQKNREDLDMEDYWSENYPGRSWLTVSEFAWEFSVHAVTVRNWIKSGVLAANRAGKKGRWMILVDDIRRFEKQGYERMNKEN